MYTEPEFQIGNGHACPSDYALVERLLRRDEAAFSLLVDQLHQIMIRVAKGVLSNHALAEEVVQETWQAVLERLPTFEGRCSLKTWIIRILLNRAKTRASRERRAMHVEYDQSAGDDLAEDEENLRSAPMDAGIVTVTPERHVLRAELHDAIEQALAQLPESFRLVITLRDIAGWSSEEVCGILGLSEANQRVMLHRARAKLRQLLARYVDDGKRLELSPRGRKGRGSGRYPLSEDSGRSEVPLSHEPLRTVPRTSR